MSNSNKILFSQKSAVCEGVPFLSLRNCGGNSPRLLDFIKEKFGLKNDAALARLLRVPPPTICKIRHSKQAITPAFLIRIHDATKLSLNLIREMAELEVVQNKPPKESEKTNFASF